MNLLTERVAIIQSAPFTVQLLHHQRHVKLFLKAHVQEVLPVRPITLCGVCSDGPEASCQEIGHPQSQEIIKDIDDNDCDVDMRETKEEKENKEKPMPDNP